MEKIVDVDVLRRLDSVGWTPQRRVNVNREITLLEAEGWEVFREAKEFLESFNDLPYITGSGHSIYFKTSQADDNRNVVINWEKQYGYKLCPIGERDQILTIYISSEGNFLYSDLDRYMVVCGSGIKEGLRLLMIEADHKAPKFTLNRAEED